MNNYAPVKNWKQRKRAGMMMSHTMFDILAGLRAGKEAGYPFLFVKANSRTLRHMTINDWISPSKGHDGTRYIITLRGLKALEIFEQPTRRYDGICPRCNERPRMVSASGKLHGYCRECNQLRGLRQYRLKGRQVDSGAPCSRCGERPRHRFPSGFTIGYCKECRTEMRKAEKRRKADRLLERLRRGEAVLCIRCKAAPRYHTEHTVYDYCHTCYRELQRDWQRRQKQERAA